VDLRHSAVGDSLIFQQWSTPAFPIKDSPICSRCNSVYKHLQDTWRPHSAQWNKKWTAKYLNKLETTQMP
jgi:hypothetical protein